MCIDNLPPSSWGQKNEAVFTQVSYMGFDSGVASFVHGGSHLKWNSASHAICGWVRLVDDSQGQFFF